MDTPLTELAPNVYWMAPEHRTDRPALGAIAGEHTTLMVDAGASVRHTHQFLDALGRKSVAPVGHVVLTHSHWDHVFGASSVEALAISSEETREHLITMATYDWSEPALDERVESGLEIPMCRDCILLELDPAERKQLKIRVPDLAFRTELTIELGGRLVRIIHVGGDHASDSSIVVLPGAVAFLGDCVYHNLHTEPNFYTRGRLFPLLDRLLALDVDYYVQGHHDLPTPRSEFQSFARALRAVGETVQLHELDAGAIERALADRDLPQDASTIGGYVKTFQAGLAHEMG